jgi:hypothetical protein
MAMGTNDQSQTRTRNPKRDATIYGFAGAMLALVFVMTISSVDAWYMVLGSCLIGIMAVVYVAKAIVMLRRDDSANSSGGNDIPGRGADVKVQDGATYTVVKRSSPAAGQRSHYWLGDNGQEIELTHEEAARLS